MGTTARRVGRVVMLSVFLVGAPAGGWAQPVRGVVVDQTDLPLPDAPSSNWTARRSFARSRPPRMGRSCWTLPYLVTP
jgi:hypothetical protein